ncbi:hypothetical protein [Catalinimonas niigatensis]|uniref:hypothetical protein n=1 Tax=Catalinimonas niigatensis TaxID=1397264 RepID=UPI002665A829|nr:hypothetical protein [Catalinimonas niigatensis]WPP51139.1 hypothetical protein PZB72_01860 [Catalinimonas niigatensis]
MKLNEDWLTNGLIDLEYKKYILLAYMKEIQESFNEKKLYPFLSELVFHYNNLIRLKENKNILNENFPKQLSKADFENLKLSYQRIVQDDELMKVIEEIIHFAIPQLKKALNVGANIYEEVARHIVIEPIGIAPLFNQEGYLFICEHNKQEINIFRYQITTFNTTDDNFRGIYTEFMEKKERNLISTLERIKIELIRTHKSMPNPATFAAFANLQCPLEETLLPITKRKLVKQLGQAA